MHYGALIMFDTSMQEALHKSTLLTRKQKQEFITLEHFLLCALNTKTVSEFMNSELEEPVIDQLKVDLTNFIKKTHQPIPRLTSQYNPEPTIGLHRCIEKALKQAQGAGKNSISALHVILTMFEEDESYAVYLLEQNEITPLVVMEFLSGQPGAGAAAALNTKEDPLKKFCENLNDKYKNKDFAPLIGRETEIKRVLEVLSRKTKNNPLLVGDPGVGKTAIGEGLAELSVEKRLPEKFSELQIFGLDLAALLAGSKYRGDFEARMKSLLSELKNIKNPLLFIDEIHSIVGAGTTSGSNVDFASLLKPSLTDSHLKVVGTTTYSEYRKHFAKDQALSRRFQPIFIDEPSEANCLKILEGTKSAYEEFHKVSIDYSALETTVELAGKHMPDKKFPDKAFDVLDETCAHETTINKNFLISAKEIKATFKRLYKVSTDQVDKTSSELVLDLKESLKTNIYGQDDAIEELYSSILVAYSGLKSKDKPLGSFLFTGPTGVGKTELSKQLASHMNIPFVRFDMSEYMEKHSVSRLIGAPPGYIGHDEGGRLTDEVSKHPHCVLLLDEIEKAHPDVINVLLQVMDSGSLTDSIGKKTYFNNCVLIMTSNSGAREADKGSIGFFDAPGSDFSDKAIKEFFTPEFLNRLTAIVKFKALNFEQLVRVVEKELNDLKKDLHNQNIELKWSSAVPKWIQEKAYEKGMGARPFERFINRKIRTKLAELILKNQSPQSDNKLSFTLKLDHEKKELTFTPTN